MASELKEEIFEVMYEDMLNENLMKHHMDLRISTTSLEQMQHILTTIIKSLNSGNDYRVVQTNEYAVTYYKVGQMQQEIVMYKNAARYITIHGLPGSGVQKRWTSPIPKIGNEKFESSIYLALKKAIEQKGVVIA